MLLIIYERFFYSFEGNDNEKLKRYLLQKKVVAAGSLRSRLAAAL